MVDAAVSIARICWCTVLVERSAHQRHKNCAPQRHHLGLDGHGREVLDRTHARGDSAAVAYESGGFVAEPELAKTLWIAFFRTAGMLWLYSGVTKRHTSPLAIR